jgi:O-antigen/teichoic acid export membrane protein
MKQSYSLNYLKIYFWKFLSILTGIVSMMVVIPRLTSEKEIYGIYVICISLTMFLQYADIGFLGAGQKYAAEYFGRKDMESEVRVLSFAHFILFICICIFFGVVIFFAYQPQLLITNLHDNSRVIAKSFLVILAFSSPIILLERFCRSIFTIRINDYIIQQIELAFNIIKIASVYFFFRAGHHDIVLYYVFIQLMNLGTVLVATYFIHKLFAYNFRLLFKSFRFSADMYQKTKGLAFSSMFITLAWVVYYEMDPVLIAKFLGVNKVAIYSIGLTFLSFSRSLYNTLYGPFLSRFNHLIKQGEEENLYNMFYNIVRLTFPLCIIPPIAIIFLMNPLVVGWVGDKYIDSIPIAQVLMTSIFWLFLTIPMSYMIIVKVKTRLLYVNGVILPFVFFLSILILEKYIGVLSFAIGKSLALLFNFIFMFIISAKVLPQSITWFVIKLIPRIIIPIAILFGVLYLFKFVWITPLSKNIHFTIQVGLVGVLATVLSLAFYYLTNKFSRDLMISVFKLGFSKKRIQG